MLHHSAVNQNLFFGGFGGIWRHTDINSLTFPAPVFLWGGGEPMPLIDATALLYVRLEQTSLPFARQPARLVEILQTSLS